MHNRNQYLRAKVSLSLSQTSLVSLLALSESFFALCIVQIAENERAKQQMNLMPGGSSEYELNIQPPSFGSRNFLQVNDLQPNHQFSRHDQTALQQV